MIIHDIHFIQIAFLMWLLRRRKIIIAQNFQFKNSNFYDRKFPITPHFLFALAWNVHIRIWLYHVQCKCAMNKCGVITPQIYWKVENILMTLINSTSNSIQVGPLKKLPKIGIWSEIVIKNYRANVHRVKIQKPLFRVRQKLLVMHFKNTVESFRN